MARRTAIGSLPKSFCFWPKITQVQTSDVLDTSRMAVIRNLKIFRILFERYRNRRRRFGLRFSLIAAIYDFERVD